MTVKKKEMRVPKLRFKEFEKDWIINLLGNTCTVKTGGKDTQDRIDDGLYPFFVRSNTVERINSYSFDGEAILTSGDGVGVGKNFHYINGKFDYHQRVYALKDFKEDFSGKFIYQVFVEKFYKRVMRLSAKNSVDSVRMNMITEMKMHFPSLPEQQKIASFLSAVDQKIQQLSKKKELLEHYKKGVMQQLFKSPLSRGDLGVCEDSTSSTQKHTPGPSQEGRLRFKDEHGEAYPDWELTKLKSLCEPITKGTTPNKFVSNGVTFIKIEGIKGINFNKKKCLFIDEETHLKDLKRSILKVNDILFAIAGSVGKLGLVTEDLLPANTNQAFAIIRLKDLKSLKFILQVLNSRIMKKYIYQSMSVGAQPNLNLEQMGDFKFLLPCIEEQQKIATYLSSIDVKIESVGQQIEKTQAFKKGLLQQMFV